MTICRLNYFGMLGSVMGTRWGKWMLAALVVGICFVARSTLLHPLWLDAQKSNTTNELKLLYTAIVAYAQGDGRLPPAITWGIDGTPLSGWRLELVHLAYGLKNPPERRASWLAMQNQRAAQTAFVGFAHVSNCEVKFAAITGPECAFDNHISRNLVDCGASALLCVSTSKIRANWASPSDFRFDELVEQAKRGDTVAEAFGLLHNDFVAVLFSDGEVGLLGPNAPLSAFLPLVSLETTSLELRAELIRKHGSMRLFRPN